MSIGSSRWIIAISLRIESGVSGRETQDVSSERQNAVVLPGQEHLAVFSDLVLSLLRRQEIIGIDVLKPDEHARDARAFCFLDKIRNLVTKRVHLDEKPKRNTLGFP